MSDNKDKISNFLYDCLSKQDKKDLNKLFHNMDLDNPPVIILKKDKNKLLPKGYKNCLETEIKLIPGWINTG